MENQIFICENCGKEHNGNYGSGRFCSKSCANTRHHSEETKKKIGYTLMHGGKWVPFNNEIRREKAKIPKIKKCKYCSTEFDLRKRNSKYCSEECKEKWLKENVKYGGYRKGSGRGHKGFYKGFFLDSTWELAFLIYHLDNNSNIKRCDKKLEYEFDGEKHFYNPDFEIDGIIYEIKGFKTNITEEKLKHLPENSKVLYYDDMLFYINYCKDKYNVKHLEELYDNSYDNNYECAFCGKLFYRHGKFRTGTFYCSRSCAGKGMIYNKLKKRALDELVKSLPLQGRN